MPELRRVSGADAIATLEPLGVCSCASREAMSS